MMRDVKEVAGTEKWGHLPQIILAASGRSRIQTQVFPLQIQYYLLTSIGYYTYALLCSYSSHKSLFIIPILYKCPLASK